MNPVEGSGIAVVGGGVIGVASALALQMAGHRTLLIEKSEPGSGCSFGNAGVIATSFVLPLSSPRHILAAPRMLLDPLGPLAIRFSHLAAVAPWLLRFILNTTPSRQRRITENLKALNALALPAWRDLLDQSGDRNLLVERGMLEVARDGRGIASLRLSATRLRAAGVALLDLNRAEIGEIEPSLSGRVLGGVLHRDVAHVEDPFGLTQVLLSHFITIGGRLRQATVLNVCPTEDGVRLDCDVGSIATSQVVITAGSQSARLLVGFGLRVPLGVEHGYHLMVPRPPEMPTRPISFHSESFLATPMRHGLRLAGTVELARADAKPVWKRADRLLDLARRYLPDLDGEEASRWMGGRPSFPDSLPAIGRVTGAPRIIYAFGHQHLGLTLAAVTAKSIQALVAAHPSPLPLDSYSLERFGPSRGGGRPMFS